MQAPDTETLTRFGWTDKKEVRIPGRMLRSKAFIELSNTAKFVLMLFLFRRTWSHDGKGKNTRRIYNNRGLKFSYTEAEQVWGIIPRTFRDCIIQLIEHGFLEVENPGKSGTLQGTRVCTIYRIIADWERYGTPEFVKPIIPQSIPWNDCLKKVNAARKSKFSTEVTLSGRLRSSSVERVKVDA